MRIGLIIAEFESGFASSFQHTAKVQYDVDFDSSTISNILDKLVNLKEKIQTGNLNNDVKVGWKMDIKHVKRLITLLNHILDKYEELFSYRPVNQKIYFVNHQLRESELISPKDFANEVIKSIFIPEQGKKLTKKEQLELDAQNLSRQRALKDFQKLQRNKK